MYSVLYKNEQILKNVKQKFTSGDCKTNSRNNYLK